MYKAVAVETIWQSWSLHTLILYLRGNSSIYTTTGNQDYRASVPKHISYLVGIRIQDFKNSAPERREEGKKSSPTED